MPKVSEKRELRLREAREKNEREGMLTAGELAYMARVMVLTTMPHREVIVEKFIRENDFYRLTMQNLSPNVSGLPYGVYPRMIFSWITSSVVQKREQEIELPPSMAQWIREIGLSEMNGRNLKRFKDQVSRLLFSTIVIAKKEIKGQWEPRGEIYPLAEKFHAWFNPDDHEKLSYIRLGSGFYKEILKSSVPINKWAIQALSHSSMAIDIYVWLTYRMSTLERFTAVSWVDLKRQLGADFPDTKCGRKNFRVAFMKHLKEVLFVYPEAKVKVADGKLVLLPSPPHVPARPQGGRIL